ncbi:hypothetical protein DIY08_03375 [Shewanella xiamenensis]|nr:hypothetical protein DIY08_03375 [Shewanella xiamenensis]
MLVVVALIKGRRRVGKVFIFLNLILLFSLIPSLIFNLKVFSFQYYFLFFALYLIVKPVHDFFYKDWELFLFILLPFLFSMLFFHETHPPQRYSIFNGDPNYTAIIYFAMFFSFNLSVNSRFLSFLSWGLISYVFFMTGSRMLLLILIFYILYSLFQGLRSFFSSRFFVVLTLIVSAAAQPLMSIQMDRILTLLAFTSDSSRYVHIGDSSNRERLNANRDSINFLIENKAARWVGSSNYLKENPVARYIPHHWFMLLSVSYGLYFAFALFFCLLFVSIVVEPIFRFYMSLVFISAGILGAFPIAMCLPVFFLVRKNVLSKKE